MTDYTHYKMLIDGQWVPASDGAKFNSLNPTTGKVLATVPEATAEDVDRAVRAADRAFNQGPWPAMSASERGHCLRRLAMLLAERSDELGTIETTDTGKMLKETRWQAKYISEFFIFSRAVPIRYTAKPCRLINLICLSLPTVNRWA